uniref:RNA-directed RNA polymerase L n=1 Tax=Clastoptera arizonana TaxID=38151 RepID=A0A1B6CFW2_9HEMI
MILWLFLQDVAENGFGYEDSVTAVYPKEQENKEYARLFGLLTLRKRMYVVLTEALIAEHILPYFPEITMMDDEISLLKKIYLATTNRKSYTKNSPLKSVILSFDFQKWNSNMRREETESIFQDMDDLMGLGPCIIRTHDMFEGKLYLADGSIRLKLDLNGHLMLGPGCWTNHLGGIEGLRQKGWTIFTIIEIKTVAERLGIIFQLMGQGDNQVIKLSFEPTMTNEQIIQKIKLFLKEFNKLLSKIGPPLKMEETWVSSTLYIYGKTMIYKGMPLNMSMKRLCKMTPLSNEAIPTIESALSSISANLSAALSKDFNTLPLYYVYLLSVVETYYIHLDYSPITCKGLLPKTTCKDLSFKVPEKGVSLKVKRLIDAKYSHYTLRIHPELLVALTLFPKALGGYPVSLMNTILTRGFPDPVTDAIAMMKLLRPHLYPPCIPLIDNLMSGELSPVVNPLMLCQDPVSINWRHPSSPGEQIKRRIFDNLKYISWIRNPLFKAYLAAASENLDHIAEYLVKMTPLFPRFCKEYLAATVPGSAYDSISRITKTNTMIHIMNESGVKLKHPVIISEQNYFNSVLCRILDEHQDRWDPMICATHQADYWRNQGWRLPIIGVTVASPIEAFSGVISFADTCESHTNNNNYEDGFILMKPFEHYGLEKERGWLKTGPGLPYLGAKTVEKVYSKGKITASLLPNMAKTAIRLQNSVGWICERNSNMAMAIQQLVSAISNVDSTILTPPDETISGSAVHRFIDRATDHGGSASIGYGPLTWLYLSTSYLVRYAKGTANVNLHFQATICTFQHLISISEISDTSNASIHCHIDCGNCIQPIYEEKLDFPVAPPDGLLPSYPDNPWCFFPNLGDLIDYNKITDVYLKKQDESVEEITIKFHAYLSHDLVKSSKALSSFMLKKMLTKSQSELNPYDNTIPVGFSFKTNMKQLLSFFLIRMISWMLSTETVQKSSKQINLLSYITNQISEFPLEGLSLFGSLVNNINNIIELTQGPFYTKPPNHAQITSNDFNLMILEGLKNLWYDWTLGEDLKSKIPIVNSSSNGWRIDQHPIYLSGVRSILISLIQSGSYLRGKMEALIQFKMITQSEDYLAVGYALKKDLLLTNLLSECDYHQVHINPSVIRMIEKSSYIIEEDTTDYLAKQVADTMIQSSPVNQISSDKLPKAVSKLYSVTRQTLTVKPIVVYSDISSVTETNEDPDFFKDYLGVLVPTTACYKLLSIMNQVKLNQKVKKVACLGDGAGGFLLTMLRLFPDSKGFFNTLIDYKDFALHASNMYVPPAIIPFPALIDRILDLERSVLGMNNLLSKKYPSWLKSLNHQFDILTCDAEGDIKNSSRELELYKNLLDCGKGTNCNTIIFKAYVNTESKIMLIGSLVLNYYKQITIFRSLFSTRGNTEVYVVGQDLDVLYNPVLIKSQTKEGFLGFSIRSKHWKPIRIPDQVDLNRVKSLADSYTLELESPWMRRHSMLRGMSLSSLIAKKMRQEEALLFPEDFWDHLNVIKNPFRFGGDSNLKNFFKARLPVNQLKSYSISYLYLDFLSQSLESCLIRRPLKNLSLYCYLTYKKHWAIMVVENLNIESINRRDIHIKLNELFRKIDITYYRRLFLYNKLNLNVIPHPSRKINGSFQSIFTSEGIKSSKTREFMGNKYLPQSQQLSETLMNSNLKIKKRSQRIFMTGENDKQEVIKLVI